MSGTHKNKCKNNSITSQTVSHETSGKFYGDLKIVSLNVCGLKSRVQYPEFVELLNQYDNADVISVQGYTFYSQPRKQKYIRKSGGLGFFVRDNLSKFITILESTSEYIAWLKNSNRLRSLKADIQIGAVYIPPQQSRLFNEDEH